MPPPPAVPTLAPPTPAAAPPTPKVMPALPPNAWPAALLPAVALAPPLPAPESPELPALAGFVPVLEQAQKTRKVTAARLRPEAARVIGSICTQDKGRKQDFPCQNSFPGAAHEPAAAAPVGPPGPSRPMTELPRSARGNPTRLRRWGLPTRGLDSRAATPLRVCSTSRMWRFCTERTHASFGSLEVSRVANVSRRHACRAAMND